MQKIEFAVGTIYAPSYANIFKGAFEKTYVYPYINLFWNIYYGFIDEIFFFLWNETVIQFQEFIEKRNNCYSTIKFDFKFSKTSIEILDSTVYKSKEKISYWELFIVN